MILCCIVIERAVSYNIENLESADPLFLCHKCQIALKEAFYFCKNDGAESINPHAL